MTLGSSAATGDGRFFLGALALVPRPSHGSLVLLAFTLFFGARAAATGPAVVEQLERMAGAMRTLNYEGILVYLQESRLESMRIVHRVEDGQVHERLESLTGPVRTITWEPNQVTCRLSDEHPISVQRQGIGSELFRSKPIDVEALTPHYLIHPLGRARVAGRQTDVVGIIPRDGLRYGYRFYLDRETGLPLKSDLMGARSKPIEQIMFTSLTLDDAQMRPLAQTRLAGGKAADDAKPLVDHELPSEVKYSSPWRFESLPAGFKLAMYDRWPGTGEDGMEHFVLSDGLASVSVYVEKGSEDGLQGDSHMGAIHAVGGRVAGHQVTVVGEVPAPTVRAVLSAIVFQGSEDE